jgi:hypothetical protein
MASVFSADRSSNTETDDVCAEDSARYSAFIATTLEEAEADSLLDP